MAIDKAVDSAALDGLFEDIADAIRGKNGSASTYTPAQMAAAIAAIQTGIEPELVSYEQMQDDVADYLENVDYTNVPYQAGTSEIADYAPSSPNGHDRPVGAAVTLPAGTLRRGSYVQTVTAGATTLYNDSPAGDTPFTVSTLSGVQAVGTLRPSGALRMIYCPQARNVRDLGGWSCDGGTVKYGKLFRGSNVAATNRDVLVNQCGVRFQLDLRGAEEAQGQTSSPLGEDVGYAVFDRYAWYTIADTALWKQILRTLVDNVLADKPIYFHCAAGADRTGTLACIIEAMLGVSRSDIDKDYELTCFYSGVDTDAHARRRDETEWIGLMNEIDALSPGSTFRDKVLHWAASLGISPAELNAFRAKLIDGTPGEVLDNLTTYTVTKTLSHAAVSGVGNSVDRYDPILASVAPDSGYVLSGVTVTMGGADITAQCFCGTDAIRSHSVSLHLTDCSAALKKSGVIEGQMYCNTLTADPGYTLEGASVTITMGGVNVAQYYSDGKIQIPAVTGDVEITVTAVKTAPLYNNQILSSKAAMTGDALYNGTGYKQDYRYNSSGVETAATGIFTTGYIPVKSGDVIRFYGDVISGTNGNANSAFYNTSGTRQYAFTPNAWANGASVIQNYAPSNYDSVNQVLHSFTAPADGFMVFSCLGTFNANTTIITINEEIT